MSVCNWLARALAIAQIQTFTPGGTIAAGDQFWITINGKTIVYSATLTTVASVTAGFVALLSASTIPEFAEVTWTDGTTTIIGTGTVAGRPFTATVNKFESDGTTPAVDHTFVTSVTTTATGPNNWNDANNWSSASIPTTGDTANVDLSLGSITDGLAQSSVTLAVLNIFSSRQNQPVLGLPATNANGYTEYRAAYLAIGATACMIDAPYAGRIKLDNGSVATTTEARNIGQSIDAGLPAGLIKGTSTSNSFEFKTGSWGLAFFEGEASAYAALIVGPTANVVCGTGVTTQTLISTLGTLLSQSAFTTWKVFGGTSKFVGTGAGGTLTLTGGTMQYESSGTCTAGTIGNGLLDFSGDGSAKTFTDLTLNAGARVNDPRRVLTVSNKVTIGTDVSSYSASGSGGTGI